MAFSDAYINTRAGYRKGGDVVVVDNGSTTAQLEGAAFWNAATRNALGYVERNRYDALVDFIKGQSGSNSIGVPCTVVGSNGIKDIALAVDGSDILTPKARV